MRAQRGLDGGRIRAHGEHQYLRARVVAAYALGGVAGFPGMVGPLWMIVTFAALALRRTTGNR